MKRCWFVLSAIVALCGACRMPGITVPAMDEELHDPTMVVVKTPPSVPATASLAPDSSPSSSEENQVGKALQTRVEDDLGLGRDTLKLISIEAKTWADTSLGCPEPGMVYAQVLTEGWLIVYEGPDLEKYPVHADNGLLHFVICRDGSAPVLTEEPGDLRVLPVLKVATDLLAETLDVPVAKVAVQDIAYKMWPNSCLGCAGPMENCLAVVTPGYQVQLMVDGQVYTVSTNEDGSASRLCERMDDTAPGGE